MKVPLTSVAFSPEGAAIYLGTENGKLLLLDLRALDKPPKPIIISETGCRIEALCVQVVTSALINESRLTDFLEKGQEPTICGEALGLQRRGQAGGQYQSHRPDQGFADASAASSPILIKCDGDYTYSQGCYFKANQQPCHSPDGPEESILACA